MQQLTSTTIRGIRLLSTLRQKGMYKRPKRDPLENCEYVYHGDGLRRVPPYFYEYITFAKLRWYGKTLLEIFNTEFRDREPGYYEKAIRGGQVNVNHKVGNVDTIINNGYIVSHHAHRHEPPVSDQPVAIVHEDEKFVVIDKPAGVPVHPTGRYNHNTVLHILMKENKCPFLYPCNRLDRLTSGLMFFSKTPKAAEEMRVYMISKSLKKEYIARVVGEFPADKEITCDARLLTVAPTLGLNRVHPDGKEAVTVFRRIAFDGNTSLVHCKPLTGRTHQLRVHLQYLGHPIANDPIYANKRVWGSSLGKNGEGDNASVIMRLSEIGKTETASPLLQYEWYTNETQAEAKARRDKRIGELLTGEHCEVCGSPLYTDPSPEELGIWLHALRYESEEWSYKTDYPAWALKVKDKDPSSCPLP
ncbi:tRNA pseudouridylate synthase [Schizosaccharomyces octosporus yFS286]|uniref:Pseudouridine synthase n=1 Tax=Schizosaccharomyces octosporus (strain yFS286) TaxID=483514 RepID=S9PXS0_SCHOY|nr:tRNA pseudouridylate synthase [Schizosaccharomyces octosporus yFS286]EPX72772.1 tRNA pseudouridylate synthase [Schizosaccharomyces octosporus yFS286]